MIVKLNIFVGKICKSEEKMDNILLGKSINDFNFNDLQSVVPEGLLRNVFFKFIGDLKDVAHGSKGSIIRLQEERYPKRSIIKSTQYESCVVGSNESDPDPLGKSVPHVAGVSCATGQAVFFEAFQC